METQQSSKIRAIIVFIGVTVFLGFYCFASWFVLTDRLFSIGQLNVKVLGRPHSAGYYAQMAGYKQYFPHQPDEIDRLFQHAIVRSPADPNIFVSYFEYLYARNCCVEKAAKLIQGAVERSPKSLRLYPAAVTYLLRTGDKRTAFRYFQQAIELKSRSIPTMISIAAENNVSARELMPLIPRSVEGLSALAEYLSKDGSDQKETWFQIVAELHTMQVEPIHLLKTAQQAFRFQEIEMAQKYANLALKHPETERGAKKLLTNISRKKRGR